MLLNIGDVLGSLAIPLRSCAGVRALQSHVCLLMYTSESDLANASQFEILGPRAGSGFSIHICSREERPPPMRDDRPPLRDDRGPPPDRRPPRDMGPRDMGPRDMPMSDRKRDRDSHSERPRERERDGRRERDRDDMRSVTRSFMTSRVLHPTGILPLHEPIQLAHFGLHDRLSGCTCQ